jgi:GT2 family glycosyltransferase
MEDRGMPDALARNEPTPPSVSVVTVTYGNRWPLLVQMLRCLESDAAVARIIVVENGAVPITPLVAAEGLRKVIVVKSRLNLGSAGGFKLGLEAASTYSPTWLWLLDDDNLPQPTALETILNSAIMLDESERARTAFAALRPALHGDLMAGVEIRRCYPPRSSFCGFHVAGLPYKVARRLHRRPAPNTELPARISLPYVPYGGLFFHALLLDQVGMPNEELVVYADDTEFSHRIVKAGGCIWLLTDAKISELEQSWSSKAPGSSFERWLKGGSDLQVFYGARNRAHFDRHTWLRSKAMYAINRLSYLALLRLFALRSHAGARYKLFHRAVSLGERGRLGMSKEYPLKSCEASENSR